MQGSFREQFNNFLIGTLILFGVLGSLVSAMMAAASDRPLWPYWICFCASLCLYWLSETVHLLGENNRLLLVIAKEIPTASDLPSPLPVVATKR